MVVMDILLNPNIAYLLLVAGFVLAILSLFAPGTGLLEIGALFALLLAGWSVYNLPVNYWALGLLILGVFPFLLALRKSGQVVYLVVSILALVIGSSFLFQGEGWLPAVNPLLALFVSIVTAVSFWWIGRKAIEAELSTPSHNLHRLIGAIGEAKSEIRLEGSVQVAGELWSARSQTLIPEGSEVRVVGREGFILDVEPDKPVEPVEH
jgi:membrane-bound serine protease (ClpP class)